ncbi:phytanoyl-CoA dioxygenase family protein [Streptomyces olivaceiscleroticus]|uniref:Fe2OG dioxygenase domain-containing protein n=1 Tax=Streptomyces olivaceiscleroticus TaxID=68245 RepID=A0ABN0ZZC7_9ACTN
MPLAPLRVTTLRELDLGDVLAGDMVVIRGGLDQLATGSPFAHTALASVAAVASPDAAHRLASLGLEGLHTVAEVAEIRSVRDELDRRVRPAAHQLLLRFAEAVAPQRHRLYVSDHLGVRIMPPRSCVDGREGQLRDYTGFLLPTDAHVDSWFNTALNSVNLWMAVSRVRHDNGLLLWPDAYRSPLRHDGVRLVPHQQIGEPVEVELGRGDVLLFAGDHLHATRPNTGPETRWVVTKRICLGPPRYHPRATGWTPYADPRLLGTPLAPLAPLRSTLTAGRGRQLLRSTRRRLPLRGRRYG